MSALTAVGDFCLLESPSDFDNWMNTEVFMYDETPARYPCFISAMEAEGECSYKLLYREDIDAMKAAFTKCLEGEAK
jgi:hypothetical protein